MNKTAKISAVVNTYNAAKYLDEALEALEGFDEIVVCDMESTDETMAIAQKHGARVVTFPRGDCRIVEPARNFAIKSARYEWVILADADEIITPQLRDYLYRLTERADAPDGLFIPRRNMFWGRFISGSHDSQLRFFRREKIEWPEYIHAIPHIDGRVEQAHGVWMDHLDDPPLAEELSKLNTYSDCEKDKRRGRHYGTTAMLLRPLWATLRCYFILGAWRDGKRGLARSMMKGMYQFVLVAKLLEERLRKEDQCR